MSRVIKAFPILIAVFAFALSMLAKFQGEEVWSAKFLAWSAFLLALAAYGRDRS